MMYIHEKKDGNIIINGLLDFSQDEIKKCLPELQRFAETGSIKATEKRYTFFYKGKIFNEFSGFIDRCSGDYPKLFDTWDKAAEVYLALFGINSPVEIRLVEVAKNKLCGWVEAQYA